MYSILHPNRYAMQHRQPKAVIEVFPAFFGAWKSIVFFGTVAFGREHAGLANGAAMGCVAPV